ncbi:MAG: YciI family protein [Actinomycetota bacterium]
MKVLMLFQETDEDIASRTGPAAEAYWGQWMAYSGTIAEQVVGGNVLNGDEHAVTLRIRAGERQIQDGPYADSKESLGGYMILDVESMDEALELASTCPAAATGAVELRPVVEMPAGVG